MQVLKASDRFAKSEATAPKQSESGRPIFFGPIDLLLLGGLSILILPLLLFIPDTLMPTVLLVVWLSTDLINHPHFAASYLIFYRSAFQILFDQSVSGSFKLRYIFAGGIIPVLMIAFFAYAISSQDIQLIGYAGNAMLFLVGWHYAKQGFGILIVDSVYRKKFFNAEEKRLLLINAHICWLTFWIFANELVSERTFWGLSYFSIDFPTFVVSTFVLISTATSLLTFRLLIRRYRNKNHLLPIPGTVAYLVSVYFWLLGRLDPALLLLIPMFHSLQYLVIVARLEKNRSLKRTYSGFRLLLFCCCCLALGYMGFWMMPEWVGSIPTLTSNTFGTAVVAAFSVWIFINIHHYFLDNVIWKKDNPEISRYLFSTS